MPEKDEEEEVAGNEKEITTALNRAITVIVDCINVTSSYSYKCMSGWFCGYNVTAAFIFHLFHLYKRNLMFHF